jgi:tRNA dimethylallyltransferase
MAFPDGVVLAIFGPTASGKTAVAEEVAERLPAELVSADSMQVYRGLPILSNQSDHPAHLVGIWALSHEASVGEYERLAHAAIDDVLDRGLTPVVVGGTGLYLRAALAELALPPPPPPGARRRWERAYDEVGPAAAHALLAERDEAAAARIHPNDRRRVVRALELVDTGGSLRPARDRLWDDTMRHPTFVFGLDVPKPALDRRIEERTRRMVERGVVAEVERALDEGLSHTARAVHGLDEFARLPLDEAVPAYNASVRRYAAYQRKWMRRMPGLVSVAGDRPPGEIADEIVALARTREPLPRRRGA